MLFAVNQILDFRKKEVGKLKLSPINDDIVSFCKNIFSCFEEHAKQRYINYSFYSELQTLNIDFDSEKLDKIIFNILSNAFKFSPDHSSIDLIISNNQETSSSFQNRHKYEMGSLNTNKFVEILISDTGVGISKENLSKVFDRFFQVDNTETQGTGLGLALTKEFIDLHGGTLIIDSKVKSGTAFRILLPHKQLGVISKSRIEPSDYNR